MSSHKTNQLLLANSTRIIALSGIVALAVCLLVLVLDHTEDLRRLEDQQEHSEFPSLVAAVNRAFDAHFQPAIRGLSLLSRTLDWDSTLRNASANPAGIRQVLSRWAGLLQIRSLDLADRHRRLVYCDWSEEPVQLDPAQDRDAWFFEFWRQDPMPELTYNLYAEGETDLSLYLDQLIRNAAAEPVGSLGARIHLNSLQESIRPLLVSGEQVLLVDGTGQVLLDLGSLGAANMPVYDMQGLKTPQGTAPVLPAEFLAGLLAGENSRGSVVHESIRYLYSRYNFWGSELTAVILFDATAASAAVRAELVTELLILAGFFLFFVGGVLILDLLLNRRIVTMSRMLKASKERLEDLVSILSHDLGNELVVLQQSWNHLEARPDQDLARELSHSISSHCRNIRTLLQNSINVCRLDLGRDLVVRREFDLRWQWDKLRTVYATAAREKGQELIMPDICACLLVNDEEVLGQILANLLHNAVKFSPPGGTIRVALEEQCDDLVLVVADSGPGFSLEDRSRLHSKFTRLSARPSAGESSTGLGLYIVRQLALACGLRVELLGPGHDYHGLSGAVWQINLGSPVRVPDQVRQPAGSGSQSPGSY